LFNLSSSKGGRAVLKATRNASDGSPPLAVQLIKAWEEARRAGDVERVRRCCEELEDLVAARPKRSTLDRLKELCEDFEDLEA
jgi:hypothetical protein